MLKAEGVIAYINVFILIHPCIKQPPALIGPGFQCRIIGLHLYSNLTKFPDYTLVLIKANCNPLFSKFSYSQSIKKL